jgi:hypothetical protein
MPGQKRVFAQLTRPSIFSFQVSAFGGWIAGSFSAKTRFALLPGNDE